MRKYIVIFSIMMCSFFSLFIKKSYTHNKHESEYLNHILENNKQFVKKTDKSIFEKTATIQTPEAVVISCSDSRVYAEKIFGKEIGDFFVIRTAGHVIGQIALQSVEFALSNLGVKKIIILGHTNCGAVRATINKCSKNHKTSDKNTIINFILKSYNEVKKNCSTCSEEQVAKKTTEMNIFKTSNFLIQNSALIRKMLKKNELEVYHLLYKVENGEVEDLHFENIISNSENSEKHPLFFAKFLKNKNHNIASNTDSSSVIISSSESVAEKPKAPNFEINNEFFKGSLENFYSKPENQNKYIVLYFYPKDNSPGCTIQAKGFRDAQKDMISKGIYTIGVSMDTEEKHKDFSDSKKLNFQLISDTGGALCRAYGAENKGILSSFVPVNRITYIVGYNATRGLAEIEHVFEKPSVFSDAKDCIQKIEELKLKKGIK